MREELLDYQAMRLERDAQEAISAERACLEAAGRENGDQPDQGYNQWIRFNFELIDFPDNLEIVLQSLDDVTMDCGKLFLENKDIEVEPRFLPREMLAGSSCYSKLGACGRYCAAMGTMGKIMLRERNREDFDKIGDIVVSIYWKCLYQTYSQNVFYALSHRRDYEVDYTHGYSKDSAIGDVTIIIKHINLHP